MFTLSTKILVLADHDTCASRMACHFAQQYAPPEVEVIGACLADGYQPDALSHKIAAEAGADLDLIPPVHISKVKDIHFQIVIAIGQDTCGRCPKLPGAPSIVTWKLHCPADFRGAVPNTEDEMRQCRDAIRTTAVEFSFRGYLKTIMPLKSNLRTIFDNLSEGIIAHDFNRRITHFNKAAERITGFTREEVLGQDCHDVFGDALCGTNCSFCESHIPAFERKTYQIDITSRHGDRRMLDMSVAPMTNELGRTVGVLACMKDITDLFILRSRLHDIHQFAGIIGTDDKMQLIYNLIEDLAESTASVLITGETGTGKELVASAIHNRSPRADQPFVAINCGALPEGIIESELFGHVKGAFTGAVRDKKGRFELADGGTIFLDEVADLPMMVQVKLLRVLQESVIERVGSENSIRIDVRVISATNKDLKRMMTEGRFREDLYYRLCVVPISLPALRERRNDIPLLVDHFLQRISAETGKPLADVQSPALNMMLDYDWPGNIRQLQNAIQFALIKSGGSHIEPRHLPPEIAANDTRHRPQHHSVQHPAHSDEKPAPRKIAPHDIIAAFEQTSGNRAKAAKILGIGRATLYRYLAEYGID